MLNRWTILTVTCLAIGVVLATPDRKARGLIDDVGKMWSNVFNTGIDQFQEASNRQVIIDF